MADVNTGHTEYQGAEDAWVVYLGPGIRLTQKETQPAADAADRRAEFHLRIADKAAALARALMPGGTSGYPRDEKPYDVRLEMEQLERKVRLEALGLDPGEEILEP